MKTYVVRDAYNRAEARFGSIVEARKYCARHPRRTLTIHEVRYHGPRPATGRRAAVSTEVDRWG